MEANLEPIISYEYYRTYYGFQVGKMVTSLTKKSVVPVIILKKFMKTILINASLQGSKANISFWY